MQLTGQLIIGRERQPGTGTLAYGVNPATGERLEPGYAAADAAQVGQAAAAAAAAFTPYRQLSGQERGRFLRAIAAKIEAMANELAARIPLETGLPEGRARMETGRTCGQLRLFATLAEEGSWVDARIDHADPNRQPMPKPDVRSVLQPVGPVAVFCASNFPLAFSVAGGDTASALAAGCPVVVKAHHSHPGTAEMIGQAILAAAEECALPAGVFSLLHGEGKTVGAALVQAPEICAVGFTGSHAGGRALMDLAAKRPRPIPVYAEMGSLNPVFVLPSAMAARGEEIAKGMHVSVTMGAGQFCTCPGLVVAAEGAATQAFAETLGSLQKAAAPAVMLNSGIHAAYERGVQTLRQHGAVETLAEGQSGEGSRAGAAFFTVNARDFMADAALSAEVFGPSTTLVTHQSREQLLALAESLEGHLTATIHGSAEELAEYRDLIAILERKVGRLVFNSYPTGVEVCQAMVHGGPYPATADGRTTSVGTAAILRFARPVCYQGFPSAALPEALREDNPLGLWRLVDGQKVRG